MARVLSIEIGYSLIKILETDYKVKYPKVYSCINLDTPQGVLNDGEVTVTEELVTMIKQALTENRLKTKQVVFTITSTKIASREVIMPNVKENKIGSVVRANASDYFPVDISQYEIAYTPLGLIGEGTDNAQRKVLVLAAPRTILSGYENLAKACGLSLLALDYSWNSIYQVIKNACNDGVEMVIKVDERVSIITILENGQIVLQRSVPYGVDEAVHTMIESGAYGTLNYQQALELLRRKTCVNRTLNAQVDIAEQDGPVTDLVEESVQIRMAKQKITESMENLMRGIARVIDFYNSRNAGKQIQKTYLTGLGGDFSGLSKLLTNELGFRIVVLNRVEGFNVERSFREGSFGEYIACLGAVIDPLGFMHEEHDKSEAKGGFQLTTLTALSVLVLCLIISVTMLIIAYLPFKEARDNNQSYRVQIEQLSESIPDYLEYTGTKQAFMYLSVIAVSTQIETMHMVDFIEELEQKMPHSFFIDSLSVNSTGFSMNVTVQSKQEAAECIEQLRTFDCIASLNVNGIYDTRTVETEVTENNGLTGNSNVVNLPGADAVVDTVVTFSVEGVFAASSDIGIFEDILLDSFDPQTDVTADAPQEGINNGTVTTGTDEELESDLEGLK